MKMRTGLPGAGRGLGSVRVGVAPLAYAAVFAAFQAACSGADGSAPDASAGSAGSAGSLGGSSANGGTGPSGNAGSGAAPADDAAPSLDELAGDPAEVAPWTILVYGHADHSLSNSLLTDMGEMAAAQLDGAVQLVVLADWDASQVIAGSDPPAAFPDGLQLYAIPGDGAEPELLAQAAEANLDDPLVLSEIVQAVFEGLPSERRGLVLWDHGGAWLGGFGGDTQNGTAAPGAMAAQTAANAIRFGLDEAGIMGPDALDFIAFDTCLMSGAEVAFPFRQLTDTYIAAAEIDYGQGWDYATTLTYFASNPDAAMADLAMAEVSHWDLHHATHTPSDALLRSHAALDLSAMDAFAAASAALTQAMVDSATFDPVELGRSAFFALSPYSSEFEQGSHIPGLRDVGQLLDALSAVQSDAAVAAAAQAARESLELMVLASSQGSLRSGLQAGVHVEQTLGASLTPERLQAYRSLASDWVAASRWDELLALASAGADLEPPLFDHAVLNAEAASLAAPPVLEFLTEDSTAAKAAVYAAVETSPSSLMTLGLVGAGLIEPGIVNEFAWDGTVLTFADGQPGMLDVWLDVAAGAPPVLSVLGLIGGIYDEPIEASLVFGAAESVAAVAVVNDGGLRVTLSTSEIVRAFPAATFTPVYWEVGSAPEPTLVTGDPISMPAQGFELFASYVPAGNYYLSTSLTDLWGNTGTEIDALSLSEPLGP